MLRRLVAQVRTQFEPQRRRDLGSDWWKLPDDPTRRGSPWRQLVVDLVSPATFSRWHRDVAAARVMNYDGFRTPMTRAVFLGVIAVCFWCLTVPWWAWAMLAPAAMQVMLEIYLHRYNDPSVLEPKARAVRFMARLSHGSYRVGLPNVTGILGAVACPLNIVAVCLVPSSSDLGWTKIAALVAALFYLNSGLADVLLAPANFTEGSEMPVFMHWLRPYVPVVALVVVTGIVAVSVTQHRWEPAVTPLAFLCGLLTLQLGSTIRNHDRMIAAAVPVARDAIVAGRADFAHVTHNELNAVKSAARRVAAWEGIPFRDRTTLGMLPSLLSYVHDQVEIDAPRENLPLEYHVQEIFDRYRIDDDEVRCDFAWGRLPDEDHHIALRLIESLCLNVVQALEIHPDVPRRVTIEGRVIGEDSDRRYILAIRDQLSPIDEDDWCRPGGTMHALREFLEDDHGGSLEQERLRDGTKRIVATWSDMVPLLEFGDGPADGSSTDRA